MQHLLRKLADFLRDVRLELVQVAVEELLQARAPGLEGLELGQAANEQRIARRASTASAASG